MDLEGIPNHLMELGEKVDSLESLYTHLYQQVLHNELVFWTVIFGVFAIIGIALYFIAQSMVQKGIEKGMKNLLDDNKLKLNKSNPEIVGALTLNNSDKDNVNIRLVKLGDEPVINIESDKNDARLTINHKKVITSDPFVFTSTLFNGWTGKATVFADSHESYKLVEVIYEDLSDGVWTNGTVVSMLPRGFAPKTKIKFKGYNDDNVELLFTINTDGNIIITSFGGAMKNINAHVVFVVHDYEIN